MRDGGAGACLAALPLRPSGLASSDSTTAQSGVKAHATGLVLLGAFPGSPALGARETLWGQLRPLVPPSPPPGLFWVSGAIRILGGRKGGWDIRPRCQCYSWMGPGGQEVGSESQGGLVMASHTKKPLGRTQI